MLNVVLGILIVIIVVLLAAKLYTDRQPNRGAALHASPKRRAKLSKELAGATGDAHVRERVVDTEGRVGLALTDDNRLVILTATWTAKKSGEESATFEQRVADASQLVHADVREPFYSERLKNGVGPIYMEAVELTLFVDDLESPVYTVNFLEDDELAGSPEHMAARTAAMRWEGLVRALQFRASNDRLAKGQLAALQSRARGA
jgi:hypothetical protein